MSDRLFDAPLTWREIVKDRQEAAPLPATSTQMRYLIFFKYFFQAAGGYYLKNSLPLPLCRQGGPSLDSSENFSANFFWGSFASDATTQRFKAPGGATQSDLQRARDGLGAETDKDIS